MLFLLQKRKGRFWMCSLMLGDKEMVSDLELCPPCVSQFSSGSIRKTRLGVSTQKDSTVREDWDWRELLIVGETCVESAGRTRRGKWKGEPNTPYALKSKAEEKPWVSLKIVQPEQMEPARERVTCTVIAWALATGGLENVWESDHRILKLKFIWFKHPLLQQGSQDL